MALFDGRVVNQPSAGAAEVPQACWGDTWSRDLVVDASPTLADHEICKMAFMDFCTDDDILPTLPQQPCWLEATPATHAPPGAGACAYGVQLFDLSSVPADPDADATWDAVMDMLDTPTASQGASDPHSPFKPLDGTQVSPRRAQLLSPGTHRFAPTGQGKAGSTSTIATVTATKWDDDGGLRPAQESGILPSTAHTSAQASSARAPSSDSNGGPAAHEVAISGHLPSKACRTGAGGAIGSTSTSLSSSAHPCQLMDEDASAWMLDEVATELASAAAVAAMTEDSPQRRTASGSLLTISQSQLPRTSSGSLPGAIMSAKVFPGVSEATLPASSLASKLRHSPLMTGALSSLVQQLASSVDGMLAQQAEAQKQQRDAPERKATQVAQRKRWGAGQLHPQQALVDAMLNARHSSDASASAVTTAPGLKVPEQPTHPSPAPASVALDLTWSKKGSKSSAGKAAAAKPSGGKRIGSTYVTQGCALTAAVAAASLARSSKASRGSNEATGDTAGSKAATKPLQKKRPRAASIASDAASGAEFAASPCQDVASTAPAQKKLQASEQQGSAVEGTNIAATPAGDQPVASKADSTDAAAKPKQSKPKPVPVTNRPPKACGIVAGILAEAKSLKTRGPISFTPQSKLDAPPIMVRPAAAHKTSPAIITTGINITAANTTRPVVSDFAKAPEPSPFQMYQPKLSPGLTKLNLTALMSDVSCGTLDTHLSSSSVTNWSPALEPSTSMDGSSSVQAQGDADDDSTVFEGLMQMYDGALDDDMWDVVTAVCALDT